MTLWQWAVCGVLYSTAKSLVAGLMRAWPYYRDKLEVPEMSDRDAWRKLGGMVVTALVFAGLGYLWKL